MTYQEQVTKAAQCAERLCSDIGAAHKASCEADGSELVHHTLLDLIGQAAHIQDVLRVLQREATR